MILGAEPCSKNPCWSHISLLWRSRRWCRNCSAWEGRGRRPCESQDLGVPRERSDNNNQAVVVRPAIVVVRHSHHGMIPETRKAGTRREACGLARRARSPECRDPSRSNRTAALPILANRRRVVSCLLVSLARCSRHNRLGAVGVLPSHERAARQ